MMATMTMELINSVFVVVLWCHIAKLVMRSQELLGLRRKLCATNVFLDISIIPVMHYVMTMKSAMRINRCFSMLPLINVKTARLMAV